MKKAVCFGEVLLDCFPHGKKIGGAPLNVALRLHALGVNSTVISCIGADEDAQTLSAFLTEKKVSTKHLQIKPEHPTGTVAVTLDKNGNASYEIVQPVAWDYIDLTPENKTLVQAADVFIFGSLVARQIPSQQTLLALLQHASFSVFDVNLRPPHFKWDMLAKFLHLSHFVKCNEEELAYLLDQFQQQEKSLENQLRALTKYTKSTGICVTLGAAGAALLWKGTFYQQQGFSTSVKDTVGAGDSFLATLLYGLLTTLDPQNSLQQACAMGALVASKSGANPSISAHELKQFIASQEP